MRSEGYSEPPGAIAVMHIFMHTLAMKIVWDEAKRRVNIKKHGLDFADARLVFAGVTYTFEDSRFDYGEQRFITLGMLHDIVLVIAHTEATREILIISMRKATKNEEAIYFQNL